MASSALRAREHVVGELLEQVGGGEVGAERILGRPSASTGSACDQPTRAPRGRSDQGSAADREVSALVAGHVHTERPRRGLSAGV